VDANLTTHPALQEIIDHHEIRKLLAVYCHGCDRGDEPRMASVYLEDSFDDHGEYKGPGWPFATRVANSWAANNTRCFHSLGQSQITVDGDKAGAETYFIANLTEANENGNEMVNLMGGRYVDTLLREGGEWKIKDRRCIRDWSFTMEATSDWLKNKDFIKGQVTGLDPSYAVLGLRHPVPGTPG
jgi:hypothetical protein